MGRRTISQQPGTKSGRRPADKLLVNRLSTAGQPHIMFLDTVFIGFETFVLPTRRPFGKRSGKSSSGRTLAEQASPESASPRPAPLRPNPPCAAPTRPHPAGPCPARWLLFGFWIHHVFCLKSWFKYLPGYALHIKSLQKQKGAGPLVSSQERRMLAAPRIKRSSTARHMSVLFLDPMCTRFALSVPPTGRPGRLSMVSWRARWTVFSLAHDPAAALGASTRRHPTPPRRALPRPAPPAPTVRLVVYQSFRFDKFRIPEFLCDGCGSWGYKVADAQANHSKNSVSKHDAVDELR